MTIGEYLEDIGTRLCEHYENDAIDVKLNYDNETRSLVIGVNYPLSENYLVWGWEVPTEELTKFFIEVYEFIDDRVEWYIKDVATIYGYTKKEGREYI